MRFRFPHVQGYLSGGNEHGIELTTPNGKAGPITRRMCRNLEHYFTNDRKGGYFVPRYLTQIDSSAAADSVTVKFAAYEGWPVEATATFRVVSETLLEAVHTFTFSEALPGFEGFISNYVILNDPPWLQLDGKWCQVELGDKEHRYFPCHEQGRANLHERFKVCDVPESTKGMGIGWPVDDATVTLPVMVTPTSIDEWYVLHAVDPAECPSFSANRMWRAHDYSLVGRDVAAGETVTCRSWMSYAQLDAVDQAEDWYRSLPV